MPFQAAYDESHGVLVFRFEGVAGAEDVEPFIQEALRLAGEHQCRRSLSDFRGAKLGLSTSEVFKLTERLQASGIDETWKRAILIDSQTSNYGFHERVAREGGHTVRVFTNHDDALNWLNWQPIPEEQLGSDLAG
ncbi:MAG: hypothetical protein HKO65_08670 [Gemmatimonadetes bacterium]|nr:hypothetical protein [Gemmatimonadota bacterium]NNM05160.1 hypothetical protein [Gemmatimonadota bacterium]